MRVPLVVGLATGFAYLASAHSVFTTLFIDDKNQGDGTCVRMPKDPDTATNPLQDLASQDMACGRDGQNAVAFTCSAAAGSKLTFEWRSTPDLSSPGSIDKSHKGPCAVYVKPVSNMATDAAAGDGWFKIFEEGYDESTKQYCTEKLIANNGLQSVMLPSGLPTGYYLVRTELLALQNVEQAIPDPQFYVGCAQIFVQGSRSTPLDVPASQSVAIPGHVQAGEPSVSFNIFASPLALPMAIPGPNVYTPGEVGVNSADSSAVTQTQGVIPPGCLIKNANWCGVEVADYTTEDGCWAASDNCYKQQQVCYDSAPPSGSKGCEAWGMKCETIQSACSASKFTGPPNKGQKLDAQVDAAVPGDIPSATGAAEISVPAAVESATPAAAATSEAAAVVPSPTAEPSPALASTPESETSSDTPVGCDANPNDSDDEEDEEYVEGEDRDEHEGGEEDNGDDGDDDGDDEEEEDQSSAKARSILARQEVEGEGERDVGAGEGEDEGEDEAVDQDEDESSPEDSNAETPYSEPPAEQEPYSGDDSLISKRVMRWGQRA